MPVLGLSCCSVTALMGLDARLRLARLYLCTDARERQGDLEDFLTAAFAGGVDIVQIRQKGMKPKAELAALEVARHTAAPYQAIVSVNDSAELAGRFSADMLHLGHADAEASVARRPLHRWALIGRSTHSTEQADRAIADPDIDYFWVGPIFSGPTKAHDEPVGLSLVRHATQRAPVATMESKPWFASGGINGGNLDDVIDAGARRICVTRAITSASDPEQAAGELRNKLQAKWRDDPAMERYSFQAAASTGPTSTR
jgi:thiamine-phosphate pyrophosphorylase